MIRRHKVVDKAGTAWATRVGKRKAAALTRLYNASYPWYAPFQARREVKK